MIRLPPRSTLFPYPPLFRSSRPWSRSRRLRAPLQPPCRPSAERDRLDRRLVRIESEMAGDRLGGGERGLVAPGDIGGRSEEHTSELPSRQYLGCRFLL